jgi:hypothetical protein
MDGEPLVDSSSLEYSKMVTLDLILGSRTVASGPVSHSSH